MENGLVEKRAQELILEATKEIINTEARIKDLQEQIKEVKNDVKGEGINVKALNTALKRYRAYLEGKDVETDLEESDIYLEVMKNQ